MSLSSDIAQGNTGRLAGKEKISESAGQIIPAAWTYDFKRDNE
jgi:hypothetical protein